MDKHISQVVHTFLVFRVKPINFQSHPNWPNQNHCQHRRFQFTCNLKPYQFDCEVFHKEDEFQQLFAVCGSAISSY